MDIEIEREHITNSKKDPQCFEPLYLYNYERILNFVYKRLVDLEETREITAIVFTKALTNISKYEDRGFPFSSWLFRIAINEINQFYRHNKKARAVSLNDHAVANIAEETGSSIEAALLLLKRAIGELSEDDVFLIEMRFFEKRSFSEIGQILEITENNAKVRTYRVLDKLKEVYLKLEK